MEGDHWVTVRVTTELLAKLGAWSQPVQVQIIETPGHGTGYEMTFREVPLSRLSTLQLRAGADEGEQ